MAKLESDRRMAARCDGHGATTLGLASIDGKASLAVEFAGARVPRGRRRGERWRSSNPKDE
jgi:hypothetical protein